MEKLNLGFLKIFISQLINTCLRFPLSLICAVVAFVLFTYQNHLSYTPSNDILKSNLVRIAFESMAGISLFYSFHIYSENKNLDIAKRIGFILLGICLLGLHFYSIPNDVYNFEINYTLRYIIILFCFHLIISFSLYNAKTEIDAFWLYNEFIFVRLVTTILYSLVFFIGIAGGLWAIDVLFNKNISEKIYIDVFAFMLLLFNTFFFLNTMPKDTHYFEREKKYQNSLRVFIEYILIPIIIIYGLILAIYLGQILLSHVLPKRWVAVPILIFSALGILGYLLAYPIRYSKKNIIFYFCKYFFYVVLPFLSLFFSSLIKRIANYGFTEQRYLALILGIWLAFICIYILISKLDNIIVFPVSLCLILILASFGPWGMYKFSANNQFHRLKNILVQNNLIVDGKILSSIHPKLNKEDTRDIASIISYLYTHNEMDKLKNILSIKDANRLDNLINVGYNEKNVGDLLGISGNGIIKQNEPINYFTCNNTTIGIANYPIKTFGKSQIIQFSAIDNTIENNEIAILDSTLYTTFLNNNNLFLIFKTDTILQLNLDDYTYNLKNYVLQSIGDTSFFNKAITKITLPYRQQYFGSDTMMYQSEKAVLYIDEIRCQQTNTTTKAISLNGYAIF